MKKRWTNYIACLFIITVFVMKGLLTVLPGLLVHTFNGIAIEQPMNDESEKNSTEEKLAEVEKVLYFDNHLPLPVPEAVAITQRNIVNNRLLYKQIVFPSIPTPPPELT